MKEKPFTKLQLSALDSIKEDWDGNLKVTVIPQSVFDTLVQRGWLELNILGQYDQTQKLKDRYESERIAERGITHKY